jgi:hypothetical protein
MNRNKFQVTDSRGKIHKRTSMSRIYTHCVVIYLKGSPADKFGYAIAPHSRAEWAGNEVLATNNASRWRRCGDHVESVEIIAIGANR